MDKNLKRNEFTNVSIKINNPIAEVIRVMYIFLYVFQKNFAEIKNTNPKINIIAKYAPLHPVCNIA